VEYRNLGRTGLKPSALGFGCNRIAETGSSAERREVLATLELALERGINFFDTANAYSHGQSERLLGEVLRGRRDQVILCSKAGHRDWRLLELDRWAPAALVRLLARSRRPGAGLGSSAQRRPNFSPRYLELALEGSLRRLQTEVLDLFYLHNPPLDVIESPALIAALERLKHKGRLRCYGVSLGGGATTDEALAVLRCPGYSILQVAANPLRSVDLERLAPACARTGVALVVRQPFDRGAVLGTAALPAALRQPAGQGSPAQLVLRSLWQRGAAVALVGMRTRAHLEDNLKAVELPPLASEVMGRLYAATETR
jgi:aryl-alcohol dehydrogenase-like predicted oxidoreductase